MGRGFSLVAAEMRRLAENVLESTKEIEGLIEEIRDATRAAAAATEGGVRATETGAALAHAGRRGAARPSSSWPGRPPTRCGPSRCPPSSSRRGTDQLAEAMADILRVTQQSLRATSRWARRTRACRPARRSCRSVVERFQGAPRMGTDARERLLKQFRELVGGAAARDQPQPRRAGGGPEPGVGANALRELHGLKGEARMMGFAGHQRDRPRDGGAGPLRPSRRRAVAGSTDALLSPDAVMVLWCGVRRRPG